MTNQIATMDPVLLDITHRVFSNRFEEVGNYIEDCKNFCVKNNIKMEIVISNRRCYIFIEDQELAVKFKLMYG